MEMPRERPEFTLTVDHFVTSPSRRLNFRYRVQCRSHLKGERSSKIPLTKKIAHALWISSSWRSLHHRSIRVLKSPTSKTIQVPSLEQVIIQDTLIVSQLSHHIAYTALVYPVLGKTQSESSSNTQYSYLNSRIIPYEHIPSYSTKSYTNPRASHRPRHTQSSVHISILV